MSLQDPLHKMSKSDPNENAFISMADDKDTIIRKFKRAVTDSENAIAYDVKRPGISNLMSIYSVFTGKTFSEIENQFAGVGYGEFKLEVGEAVAKTVCEIDAKKKEILKDKEKLDAIMIDGAEKARYMASRMLSKVYKKVGLYTPERKK